MSQQLLTLREPELLLAVGWSVSRGNTWRSLSAGVTCDVTISPAKCTENIDTDTYLTETQSAHLGGGVLWVCAIVMFQHFQEGRGGGPGGKGMAFL